jgi:hypothetical protein
MSSPASRIVIIGAGIGGLTLVLLPRPDPAPWSSKHWQEQSATSTRTGKTSQELECQAATED